MKKHWYKIYITEYPVCGSGDTVRERIPGEKPESMDEWYEFTERYDWCIE